MEIIRVLNNNAVVVENNDGEEIIVLGSGIAFQKRSGDKIDNAKIEKIFCLKKPENKSKFYELVSLIPIEVLKVTENVIKMAEKKLGKELDESIYLLLSDHIYYAVERSKEGLYVKNNLLWEMEHYYNIEYKIGMKAVQYINSELKCSLMENEAGLIAMHIVNASNSSTVNDLKEEVKDIKAIMNLVKYHFDIELKEESLNYMRFVTHLRYLINRIKSGQNLNKIEQNDELFLLVCKKYFQSYLCVEKIEKYFLKTYGIDISDEEKMYLVLHIERVRNRA